MTDATKDETTHGRVHDAYAHARETASHVYEETRAKANHALEASREAAHRTVDRVGGNPLGILVGGLAVGAAVGALVPRSAREKALLGPIGKKLAAATGVAVAAAREAGRAELENAGLTRDAAKQQARGLLDNVLKAASTAGSAAVKSTSAKS